MKSKKEDNSAEISLLSPTKIALLLILSEEPRHGYQINKVIKDRGMRTWVDLQFSTIYKTLDELENKGYIIGEKEDIQVKQSKKVYAITEEGRRILKEQIERCITAPPHPKSIFDLGLSGIYYLSKEEALKALSEYQEGLVQGIRFFEEMLGKLEKVDTIGVSDPKRIVAGEPAAQLKENPHLFIVKALFERPYYRVLGELKWLKKFIQQIEEDKTLLK